MSGAVDFEAGDIVINEGEPGKGLFILRSGTLEVFKGDVKIAQLDTPTTVFGEMSDILGKPRSCKVVAKTECKVIYMDQGIDQIIQTRPRLTKRLIFDLANRLEQTTAKLADSDDSLIWFDEPQDEKE